MLDKKFDETVANCITDWVKREVPTATELEAIEAGYRVVELIHLIRRIEEKHGQKSHLEEAG